MGSKIKNILGQKFGKLLVIEFLQINKNNQAEWICTCECGKDRVVQTNRLVSLSTWHCGTCVPKTMPKSGKTDQEMCDTLRWNRLRTSVHFLSTDYPISKEQFFYITFLPCLYCGGYSTNEYLITLYPKAYNLYTGVDRQNNDEGYTYDNSVPCCEICNRAKRDIPLSSFMAWIKRVVALAKHAYPIMLF